MIIQNYAKGALIKPAGDSAKERISSYFQSAYYKSVSLLANGCQGIGFLAGRAHEECYDYGANIAMAIRAINDIEDYSAGNYNFWSFPSLLSETEPNEDIRESVESKQGVLRTKNLAYLHLQHAIDAAHRISSTPDLENIARALTSRL